MDFPQEIIHYIVSFVHNDQPTLAALRLLNHAWNISASPHLFRTVHLIVPDPPSFFYSSCHRASELTLTGIDVFKALLFLLESNTETISHCVRRVFLGQTDSFGTSTPQQLERQQNDYAVVISSIVSRFTHMSDIVFREINWSTLSPSFSSCILGICKSPTLERIAFRSCFMPTVSTFLHILEASSNLKTLRLIHSDLDGLPDSKQHSIAPSSSSSSSEKRFCTNITTPLLHSLTVHGGSDRLLRVFKVDNLKQLLWNISHDNISGTEFLKSVGQSLESLVIKLERRLVRLELGISILRLNFSHCPRLQHLHISGLPWSLSVCPSTYFCSLFAQTPDQSLPIERLELVVHLVISRFITYTNEKTPPFSSAGLQNSCCPALGNHYFLHDNNNDVGCHPSELCFSGWLTVDDSLSRSQIFQSLKTLVISIQTTSERDVDLSSLSHTFPKLKNKGVQVIWT